MENHQSLMSTQSQKFRDTGVHRLSMAKDGNKISDLSVERVRELLADERDPKAIKRLTATREYLAGLSPDDIEEKYG